MGFGIHDKIKNWIFLQSFTKIGMVHPILLQLDLRCGAKKSLNDPPKHCLALKSFDISATRPHMLLVGGRYVRVE